MLTDTEKQKIAILRTRFTDNEWSQLHDSDDYARERIAFYAERELANLDKLLKGTQIKIEQANTEASIIINNINILQG